jgi:hypothetical protein
MKNNDDFGGRAVHGETHKKSLLHTIRKTHPNLSTTTTTVFMIGYVYTERRSVDLRQEVGPVVEGKHGEPFFACCYFMKPTTLWRPLYGTTNYRYYGSSSTAEGVVKVCMVICTCISIGDSHTYIYMV